MKWRPSSLPEVLILTPQRHHDARGYFVETYHLDRYRMVLGESIRFVQDNLSVSRQHVLRGLHYQAAPVEQGKLVQVLEGEILDVAVDVRPDSPKFGTWTANRLNHETGEQCWVPPGFAHGFLTLSHQAIVSYKTTALYQPEHERGLRWNDPELAIPWGMTTPIVSEKDALLPLFSSLQR